MNNFLQALDVSANIFISANAGSGKTGALVKRYIKLYLLGSNFSNILTITYTNAAADEMKHRINLTFKKWHDCGEEELKSDLSSLGFNAIDSDIINRARKGFDDFIINNVSRISTIHTLCQQIIKSSSGVVDNYIGFEIMDEVKNNLVQIKITEKDQDNLLKMLNDKILLKDLSYEDLKCFILDVDKDYLSRLVKNVIENVQLYCNLKTNLTKSFLGLEDDIDDQKKNMIEIVHVARRRILESDFKSSLAKKGEAVLNAINNHENENINSLYEMLFTKKGEIRKIFNKNSNNEHIAIHKELCEAVLSYKEIVSNSRTFKDTVILSLLIKFILNEYINLKTEKKLFDFYDLLEISYNILTSNEVVVYDWDRSLSHVLIDEAQDVNPLSWKIIFKLTEEFFTGHSFWNYQRTIFVIGDKKQSIFSFQGADSEIFEKVRDLFLKKSYDINMPFHDISFLTSYRSGENILGLVDRIFKGDRAVAINGNSEVYHDSFYKNKGNIEIIELEAQSDKEKKINLSPNFPSISMSAINDDSLLLEKATNLINDLVLNGDNPDDIMVIVRDRNAKDGMALKLVERLNQMKILNNGIDRFYLKRHIVFQDFIVICKFITNPSDDLNLARVLSSVFINLSFEKISELCLEKSNNRTSLWDYINIHEKDVAAQLNEIIQLYNFCGLTGFLINLTYMRQNTINRHYGEMGMMVVNKILELTVHPDICYLSLDEFVDFVDNSRFMIMNNKKECGVRIITAHSAKGLESKIVILLDISNKGNFVKHDVILNLPESNFVILPPSERRGILINKIIANKTEINLREELRLLYVILTRAKEKFYIIGQKSENNKNWLGLIKECLIA